MACLFVSQLYDTASSPNFNWVSDNQDEVSEQASKTDRQQSRCPYRMGESLKVASDHTTTTTNKSTVDHRTKVAYLGGWLASQKLATAKPLATVDLFITTNQ